MTAVVLAAIGWLVLLGGGVLRSAPGIDGLVTIAVWVAAVLFALNTLGNLAGRHPLERWGMGALTAALSVLCVLIALRR